MTKKVEDLKVKPIELKPLKEIKGSDGEGSDAFVCDLETGVCGPAKTEKETKK